MIYAAIFVTGMTRRNKLLILTVTVPILAFGALALLTPVLGKIVGYADEQPPLCVVATSDTGKPLRLARLHFDAKPQLRELFWPEPSVIEEKQDCWLVTFEARTPIYSFLGYRQSLRPTAPAMFLSIDKADYRTRIGNWCQ